MDAIEPFLCLYLIGLCDNSEQLYLPSADECRSIRNDICRREWEQFLGILGPGSLPQCDSLPDSSLRCNINFTDMVENETPSFNITCSSGFFLAEEGVCVPDCGKWTPLSEPIAVTNGILAAFAVIGIVGGCIALLGFFYKRA